MTALDPTSGWGESRNSGPAAGGFYPSGPNLPV